MLNYCLNVSVKLEKKLFKETKTRLLLIKTVKKEYKSIYFHSDFNIQDSLLKIFGNY